MCTCGCECARAVVSRSTPSASTPGVLSRPPWSCIFYEAIPCALLCVVSVPVRSSGLCPLARPPPSGFLARLCQVHHCAFDLHVFCGLCTLLPCLHLGRRFPVVSVLWVSSALPLHWSARTLQRMFTRSLCAWASTPVHCRSPCVWAPLGLARCGGAGVLASQGETNRSREKLA